MNLSATYQVRVPKRVPLPAGETLICARHNCGAVLTDQEISGFDGAPLGDRSRCPECAEVLELVCLGMQSALNPRRLARFREEGRVA